MAISNDHRSSPLVAGINGNRSDLSVGRCHGAFPAVRVRRMRVRVSTPVPSVAALSIAGLQPRSACKFSPKWRGNEASRGVFSLLRAISFNQNAGQRDRVPAPYRASTRRSLVNLLFQPAIFLHLLLPYLCSSRIRFFSECALFNRAVSEFSFFFSARVLSAAALIIPWTSRAQSRLWRFAAISNVQL